MGDSVWTDRRTLLAHAAALGLWPTLAVGADGSGPQTGDADARLFAQLAQLGMETKDALVVTAALRLLDWSLVGHPQRADFLQSPAVQTLYAEAKQDADLHPGPGVLDEALAPFRPRTRGAPVLWRDHLSVQPRGHAHDRTTGMVQTGPLGNQVVVTVVVSEVMPPPRPGGAGPGVLVSLVENTKIVDSARLEESARLISRRPPLHASYSLEVRNLCDARVEVSYVCLQGAGS